jgi:hypothetical protein
MIKIKKTGLQKKITLNFIETFQLNNKSKTKKV